MYPPVDIRVASTSCPLWTLPLGTCAREHLSDTLLSIPPGTRPEVDLLDHMLALFLFLEEPSHCFLYWLHHFAFPPTVYKGPNFSMGTNTYTSPYYDLPLPTCPASALSILSCPFGTLSGCSALGHEPPGLLHPDSLGLSALAMSPGWMLFSQIFCHSDLILNDSLLPKIPVLTLITFYSFPSTDT